jgi:CubicO group peptidase (beta-lactamase class C family)
MLLNKGAYKNGDLLSPKTIELMQSNHLSPNQMPVAFQDFILTGLGFGLGGSVLLSPSQALMLGSVGNFGWSGAAKTYFWIDPKEELVAIFMAQGMNNFSNIHVVFQNLVYQAIID